MADVELRGSADVEVRFVVDERTAQWLESIGWRRPIEEQDQDEDQEVCCTCSSREIGADGELVHREGCEIDADGEWTCGDCKRRVINSLKFCNWCADNADGS